VKYPMKVAVLGTGYMGKQYIRIMQELVETVIVCSADEAVGKRLAMEAGLVFYGNYEELFEKEDLDFVAVCLPSFLHYDASMSALRHGISVLCEKPFASTVEQAVEITKFAKKQNLHLMVAHCIRFVKEYEYLRRCIAEQRFGKLLSLHLFRHHPIPTWRVGNWLMDSKLSGGFVRDAHIHDTDILLHILGMPERVYTSGNTYVSSTVYDYDREVSVTASGSWRKGKDITGYSGYEAVFVQGVMKLENETLQVYTEEETREGIPETERFPEYLRSNDMLRNEICYFLNCLARNLPLTACPPEDSLNTMLVNEAEKRSMENRKVIRIALAGDEGYENWS